MPQCFQVPATEKPGFFAVRSGTERLTYAGLDTQSDALRDRLNAAGVEKGAFAGILLDRSLSAITSSLAVLNAGGRSRRSIQATRRKAFSIVSSGTN